MAAIKWKNIEFNSVKIQHRTGLVMHINGVMAFYWNH